MDGALAMKVVEAEEQFATNDSDMSFRKYPGLEDVKTGTALEELHDDPQLVVDHERSIVPRHVFRVALSEIGDFLLDFGYIVIGVFEICNVDFTSDHNAGKAETTGDMAVTYLLNCDDLLGLVVDSLVHGAETACAQLLQERVLAGGIVARYRIRF